MITHRVEPFGIRSSSEVLPGECAHESHVATCTVGIVYSTEPWLITRIMRNITLSIILMQFPVISEHKQSNLPPKAYADALPVA